MSKAHREINLIREYRTRLIADVVTGKLEVRGLAPETIEAGPDELGEGFDDDIPEYDELELAGETADADD